MNQTELIELTTRIKKEPSVLFLGQNYLSSFLGRNSFVEAVNTELLGGKLLSTASYADIWDALNGGAPLSNDSFKQIYGVLEKIPEQVWLRNILSMRWGMVFTSAVDSCIAHNVGPNFTFDVIPSTVKRFRHEYMYKGSLHGVYLYGSIDGCNDEFPPESCDERSLRARRGSVRARIDWIYHDILENCGILIIDGWDPERDWASFLLDNATDMLPQSIYLFGVSPRIMENHLVQELVEDGILVTCPQTFAQALNECGFFDTENDGLYAEQAAHSDEFCYNVTIRSKKGKDIYLRIPQAPVNALDKTIRLMDDDLGFVSRTIDADEKKRNFAEYLAQKRDTRWALYFEKPGFHFHRAVDDELYDSVIKELKKRKSTMRRTLILDGHSNSGKTAALMELAVKLRDEHLCPVFVIRGIPTQAQFDERLKRLIKDYFFNRQNADGEWVENVVILWDGNVGMNALDRYVDLSKSMSECNAVVVGTAYLNLHERADSKGESRYTFIDVLDTLKPDETKALRSVIRSVDASMLEKFELAVRKNKPTLLYELQMISNYEYSSEWREMRKSMDLRFEKGVEYAEQYAQYRVESNEDIWNKVREEIVERGVGAQWQIVLSKKLTELQANGSLEPDRETSQNRKLQEKAHNVRAVLDDVRLINRSLALAGQFSLELPITLLLRLLRQKGRMVKNEGAFINELLMSDALVEYTTDEEGYPRVRFRHPFDAESYVEKNFGTDPKQRKESEISLLRAIIAACRWDTDEVFPVIRLIRCFGPNSTRKYSDERVGERNYEDYLPYLPQIAQALKEHSEGDAEAMVVYAHFMREASSKCEEDDQRVAYLRSAMEALRDALNNEPDGGYSSRQKNRLYGEICANLVASMPKSRENGVFDMDTLRQFENYFAQTVATWDWNSGNNRYFDTNSLLDMWLNAVTNYYASFSSEEEARKNLDFLKLVTDSVNYIDLLLSFHTIQVFSSTALLEKIGRVYEWASDESMQEIEAKLNRQGNDTYLFLQAHNCWRNDNIKLGKKSSREDIIRRNLYALPDRQYLLNELGSDTAEQLKQLKQLKREAEGKAREAIKILEDNWDLVQRSRSCRCLYMLIRAKWLVYTGNMMLEEKQQPKLTRDQWDELYEMCRRYRIWCDEQDIPVNIGSELLRAIYLWCFDSNVQKSRPIFNELRDKVRDYWFAPLIGFCRPGEDNLRSFYVDIVRDPSGREKLVAQISEEIDGNGKTVTARSAPQSGRYKIHVPNGVLDYLLDGEAVPRNAIKRKVNIWFNTAGATLGIPERKKGEAR